MGAPVLLEMQHVRLYPIHLEAAVTTSELDLSLARLYFPRDAAVVLERGRASSTLKVALDARAGVRANVSGSLEDVVLVRRGERDPVMLVPKLTVELADFQYQDEKVQVGRFELEGAASVKDPSARGGGRFQVSTLRASVADVTWPVVRPGRVDVRSSVPGGGLLNLTGRLSPPPAASQLRLQLARVELGPWARLVPSALRIDGLAEADLRIDEPLAPYSFVDIGAGMGAAVLYASEFDFHKVGGIELDRELLEIARRNVEAYNRSTGRNVAPEWIGGDFFKWQIPREPQLFFMNNPFPEDLTLDAVKMLEASLREHPRRAMLVFRKAPRAVGHHLHHSPMWKPLRLAPYWRIYSAVVTQP